MKLDKQKVKWVAVEGSIYTADPVPFKTEQGRTIQYRPGIAFNVGRVAGHIVRLHNESLDKTTI